LNHCCRPGEHARGCWVVDLLLASRHHSRAFVGAVQ
jgi:hypothetical protein